MHLVLKQFLLEPLWPSWDESASRKGSSVVSFSLLISLLCPIDLNSISTAVLSRNVKMHVLPCPQFPEGEPSAPVPSLWAGPLCAPMQWPLTWKVSCSSGLEAGLGIHLTLWRRPLFDISDQELCPCVSSCSRCKALGSKEDFLLHSTGQAALPLFPLSSVALASETHK